MARKDIQDLYQQLMYARFTFMERGERHLHEIYNAVKSNFSELCDDSYLCRENCSQGHDQPEWQHTVRKSLEALKHSGEVSKGIQKGYWIFEKNSACIARPIS